MKELLWNFEVIKQIEIFGGVFFLLENRKNVCVFIRGERGRGDTACYLFPLPKHCDLALLIKQPACYLLNSSRISFAGSFDFSLAFWRTLKKNYDSTWGVLPSLSHYWCLELFLFCSTMASIIKGPWFMIRGPTCYSHFQRAKLDREFGSPKMFRLEKVSQGNVSFDLKNGALFFFDFRQNQTADCCE